jgi:phosphate transport system permease protein
MADTPIPVFVAGAQRALRWRVVREWLITQFVTVNAWLALGFILLIFVFIAREALPVFWEPEAVEEVGVSRLLLPQKYGTEEAALPYVWQPVSAEPKYSLMPLLLGTLKVTLIAIVFAAPMAIAAAIYTAEFAPHWVRETVKPAVEMLAGFPSVVLGFFALIVLASWLQDLLDLDYRLNALNAGLAMGLAVIPIIYTVCEDALGSVPRRLREASWALGATRAETALRIVVPAALPGIFAGVVLGFGRAIGETMIVLMASGNAAITSWSFTESVRTLSATIAAELAEVVFGSPHYRVLFLIGTILFLFTLALNSLGAWMIHRVRRRLAGSA